MSVYSVSNNKLDNIISYKIQNNTVIPEGHEDNTSKINFNQ